jgi:sugar transferase (PEP-CTERM system associated)
VAHTRIFNHYLHSSFIVLGVLEFAVLVLGVYLAFYIASPADQFSLISVEGTWITRALVFAFIMHGATLGMGVYQSFLQEGFTSMVLRTVVAYCLLGCLVYTVLHLTIDTLYLGDTTLLLAIVVSMLAIVVLRWCFFKAVDVSQLRRRVVFYGAGVKAANLLTVLTQEGKQLGSEIIGCVPAGDECAGDECKVDQGLIIAPPANWLDFIRDQNVSEIVVVADERRRVEGGGLPLSDLLDCKLAGTRVIDAINFCERETGKVELDLLNPGWMLFSDGFRFSQARDIAKRIFDLLVCFVLLLLAWPLMILTMLAIVVETGRPVIYKQVRVGLNGRTFEVLKFRSMVKNAEKDGKAVWAQQNDSRVTPVGNFIRNTRLDELPQLWNVLKGDMSFVGPRPERPEFVDELAKTIPYYQERHRVKPGLMGWAQLNYAYGASEEDAAQKLRYDLYYTKNHSLLLDILTALQTVEVILLGKGVR